MASAVLDFSPTAGKLRFAKVDGSDDALSERDGLLPTPPRVQDYSTMAFSQGDGQETAQLAGHLPRTRPLVRERRGTKARRFELLQQWEGIVTEIDNETFWAELRDLTDPTPNREVVEIYNREVDDQDKALVAPGAVFYWSIGYDTSRAGSLMRASEIKFRRTPIWSKRRLGKLSKQATIMAEKFLNAQQADQSPTAG
jgi:hypothetical protein